MTTYMELFRMEKKQEEFSTKLERRSSFKRNKQNKEKPRIRGFRSLVLTAAKTDLSTDLPRGHLDLYLRVLRHAILSVIILI